MLILPDHLPSDRIVGTVKPILGILLAEGVVPIFWQFVAEGTLGAAVAHSLGEEGAQFGKVTLVAGLHASHGLELGVGLGGCLLAVLSVGDEFLLLGVEPGAVGVALGHDGADVIV